MSAKQHDTTESGTKIARLVFHEYTIARDGVNNAVGGTAAAHYDDLMLMVDRADMDRCLDGADDRRKGVNAAKEHATLIVLRSIVNGAYVPGYEPGTYVLYHDAIEDFDAHGNAVGDVRMIDATTVDLIPRHAVTDSARENADPRTTVANRQKRRVADVAKKENTDFDASAWETTVAALREKHDDPTAFGNAIKAHADALIAKIRPNTAPRTARTVPAWMKGKTTSAPIAALLAPRLTSANVNTAKSNAARMGIKA